MSRRSGGNAPSSRDGRKGGLIEFTLIPRVPALELRCDVDLRAWRMNRIVSALGDLLVAGRRPPVVSIWNRYDNSPSNWWKMNLVLSVSG